MKRQSLNEQNQGASRHTARCFSKQIFFRLLGRPEQPFRTGLYSARDVFFFRQPYLRGPSADRRETLPHDRNLAAIAGQGRTTWGSSPKKF